jgi:hypothetical protein
MAKPILQNGRTSAALIRISTGGQDQKSQIENITSRLKAKREAAPESERHRWSVPDDHWFEFVSPRSDVLENPQFCRLMELVRADKIDTIYIDTFERLGTNDHFELTPLIGELIRHKTLLIDLGTGRQCASRDLFATIMNDLGVHTSYTERENKGEWTLRGRVDLFRDTGTWPTGLQPYGFGKRCLDSVGRVEWEWHPLVSKKGWENKKPFRKLHGRLWKSNAEGGLILSGNDYKLPTKEKRQRTVLIPGDPRDVEAVRLAFDLYAGGLSRRKICKRLNEAGYSIYGSPFSHPVLTNILANPAYTGDTYFGRRPAPKHWTHDRDGQLRKIELLPGEKKQRGRRSLGDCMVRKGTHEALIDRDKWERAQARLAAEALAHREGRKTFAGKNPNYWLRSVLHCGHCQKPMAGRTANGTTVEYVCGSYQRGHNDGRPVRCKGYRIAHAEALRLIREQARKLNHDLGVAPGKGPRAKLERRIADSYKTDESEEGRYETVVKEGVAALVEYFRDTCPASELKELTAACRQFYRGGWGRHHIERRFRRSIEKAETAAVAGAKTELARAERRHEQITLKWVEASPDMQAVLKKELGRLQGVIEELRPRTITLSEQYEQLMAGWKERVAERERLAADLATLSDCGKVEAVRRVFPKITCRWKEAERPGRQKYVLDTLDFGVSGVSTLEQPSRRSAPSVATAGECERTRGPLAVAVERR